MQTVRAGVGDVHRAAAIGASQPAEIEQPPREVAAERAGEVMRLLGPVDAVAQRQPVGARVGASMPSGSSRRAPARVRR